jgi:hypothetical protein
MTKDELTKVAEKVRDEADEEAGFYGCRVVVVVVDKDGAFRTCGSPDLDINIGIGVLARATHAFAASKAGT